MDLEKQRWNIEQCSRCHQCKSTPVPRSQKFAPICPAIEHGKFHSYSGSGKIITAYAIMNGKAGYTQEALDSVTTCSMCGACDTACQFMMGDLVQPLDGIYALRAKMFVDGQVPSTHQRMLENLSNHGNVYGRAPSDRLLWSEELQLQDATNTPVEVLLHVGCNNAFDQGQWPGLIGIVDALQNAKVPFGTLGAQEINAGTIAFELGDHELALRCARLTVEQARTSGAQTLVTCDADALSAFRNFYPRMGVNFDFVRVLHITEYLAELAVDERWAMNATCEGVVTYHDPCHLGRLSEPYEPWDGGWTSLQNGARVANPPRPHRFGLGGVYDAPRALLQSVAGTRLVEMERTREFAYCCGAGGGGKELHPEFAEQAALHRLDEAVSTGAGTLVTSCGKCTWHLSAVATKHGIDIRVTDLAGYLTQAKASPAQE